MFWSGTCLSRAACGNESSELAFFHDSRHVGFHIIMQISHAVLPGANTGKRKNLCEIGFYKQ